MASYSEFFRYLNALQAKGIDWTEGLSDQDVRNVRGWAHSMNDADWTDPDGRIYKPQTGTALLDPIFGIWRNKYGMDPNSAKTPEVTPVNASGVSSSRPDLGRVDHLAGNRLSGNPPEKAPENPPEKPPENPEKPGGGQEGALPNGEKKDGADKDHAETETTGVDQGVQKTINEQLGDNTQAKKDAEKILAEVNTEYNAVASEINDPTTLRHYQQTLKVKLGQLQDLLDNAKVSAGAREKVLEAFRNAYDKVAPERGGTQNETGGGTGGSGGDTGGGTGGDTGGTGGDTGGTGGGDELVDPLAGLGMFPSSSAIDPLANALGQLPGALGGLTSSPSDALGGLGQLAGLVPSLANAFTDRDAAGKDNSEFRDDKDKPEKPGADSEFSDDKDKPEKPSADGADKPAGSEKPAGPEAAVQPAAAEAAPEAAAKDPGTAVTLPNGQVVEAGSEKAAGVLRSVMTGSSVTDAFKGAGVDLPPPGTPVTSPVAPSALTPGSVGHFQAREPVLAMGNGKVWLDGQVQPLSALGSSPDFLGWSSPLSATRSTVAASAAS